MGTRALSDGSAPRGQAWLPSGVAGWPRTAPAASATRGGHVTDTASISDEELVEDLFRIEAEWRERGYGTALIAWVPSLFNHTLNDVQRVAIVMEHVDGISVDEAVAIVESL